MKESVRVELTKEQIEAIRARAARRPSVWIDDDTDLARHYRTDIPALLSALEAQAAELAEVRQQYVDANEARIDAEAQLAETMTALDGLLKPFEGDDCRYDHHGYCQAHFLQEGNECCVKIARKAIKEAYLDEKQLCELVLLLISRGSYKAAETYLKRNIELVDDALTKYADRDGQPEWFGEYDEPAF